MRPRVNYLMVGHQLLDGLNIATVHEHMSHFLIETNVILALSIFNISPASGCKIVLGRGLIVADVPEVPNVRNSECLKSDKFTQAR